MTQKEILDYNKLCAEFLGWKFSQNYENFDEYYYRWNKENDGVWYRDEDFVENPESFDAYYVKVNGICLKKYLYTLKFDSDWNWIMSLLEKISSLNEDDFSDETQQAFEDLLDLSLFSSKESVCKSINNFIKTIK